MSKTTKSFPLRLGVEELEEVRVIADLEERSLNAVICAAVQHYIEELERRVHPLSLEDALSLSELLGVEHTKLVENAAPLSSRVKWRDISGVYVLLNPETRQLYVGSSTEISERLTHHKHSIKKKAHKNNIVRNWVLNDLVVILLESLPQDKSPEMREYVLKKEQWYIDRLKDNNTWKLVNSATAFEGHIEEDLVPPVRSPIPVSKAQPFAEPNESSTQAQEPEETQVEEREQESYISLFVLPILEEASSSRDLLDAVERAGEQREAVVQFIRAYDSSWLTKLSSTGRFPAITKLLYG